MTQNRGPSAAESHLAGYLAFLDICTELDRLAVQDPAAADAAAGFLVRAMNGWDDGDTARVALPRRPGPSQSTRAAERTEGFFNSPEVALLFAQHAAPVDALARTIFDAPAVKAMSDRFLAVASELVTTAIAGRTEE